MAQETCKSCLAISGEKRISQIPVLIETKYTIVEHIHPAKILGWLVITPKAHVNKLSDLDYTAFNDLFGLMYPCIKILKRNLPKYEKEYVLCLAEKGGFNHVHIHIIPKYFDLPKEYWGKNIFDILSSDKKDVKYEELSNFRIYFEKDVFRYNLAEKLSHV